MEDRQTILFADAGSTKTDWVVTDAAGSALARGSADGINPAVHTPDVIFRTVSDLASATGPVHRIHLFAAGCSSSQRCAVVERQIRHAYPEARATVGHDLLGAARALYDGRSVIACILGTGSNAGFFDGRDLEDGVPSLGYVLGDEGSGNWFGRMLLRDHVSGHLPRKLRVALEMARDVRPETIIRRVYHEDRPNAWLASFMPFLAEHRTEAYVQDLLVSGFEAFLDHQAGPLRRRHPLAGLAFTGSVAHHFERELRIACDRHDVRVERIVQRPLDRLVRAMTRQVAP